jgi:zinc transport system substrate-binding protein
MHLEITMKPFGEAFLTAAFLASTSAFAQAEIKVMTSIKPVHSLVASIMEGAGSPSLIVQGAASPHTYSLKPSQADELQNADVVFWVGHELEVFLEKPLETIATKAKAVELINADGMKKFPPRETGNFDKHNDETEPVAGHNHGEEIDAHVWLDPQNAILMAVQIEKALVEGDPANAAIYTANGVKLKAELEALQAEIQTMLAPTKDKGFVVFHDAYQYFEQRFGATVLGSITTSPDVMPGAERIAELKAKVSKLNAVCVFAEPNFDPKLINAIIEGTPAKTGTLDPEASGITEGPALYATMMRGIATSIRDCLAQAS